MMFNRGQFAWYCCQIQAQHLSTQVIHMWGLVSLTAAVSLPAPFPCSSTAPGQLSRGKLSDTLRFLDCEIKQRHKQTHFDLPRAEAAAGVG